MSRGASIEEAVRRLVALRRVATAVSDPREQRRLARVQHELLREIGFSVPKGRAAAVLGVSVNALDRWIAAGRLPTVRRPGVAREEVDADALLDLAEEVDRLREEGLERAVLAKAFERLAQVGRPRRRLRPNMPARELRADFLATNPVARLRTGAELSHVAFVLAQRGRAARLEKGGSSMRSDTERPLRFLEVLRVLREHEVAFLLTGGLAVSFHGYEHATVDLDAVPEPTRTNHDRLAAALLALDATELRVGDDVFDDSFETRFGRLHLLQDVNTLDYDDTRARAVQEALPEIGGPIWIIGLDDLLTMKREAGRDLDLVDITALRMAHGLEE